MAGSWSLSPPPGSQGSHHSEFWARILKKNSETEENSTKSENWESFGPVRPEWLPTILLQVHVAATLQWRESILPTTIVSLSQKERRTGQGARAELPVPSRDIFCSQSCDAKGQILARMTQVSNLRPCYLPTRTMGKNDCTISILGSSLCKMKKTVFIFPSPWED